MMTRNQVIEALFVGKNFNDCIAKMDPAHLRDDLKMEVIAIVCEWPDDKIMALHQEGKLEFFVVRVILNQIQSSTSPFYKKFRTTFVPYVETIKGSYTERERVVHHPAHNRNFKQIVRAQEAVSDDEEVHDRAAREAKEDKAISDIALLPWYNARLIELYMEKGNYRALQEATGIPFISCYKAIQQSVKELKKRSLCQVAK